MTQAAPASFELSHEPWIPGREPNGSVAEDGILRTLGRAHELVGLSGDVPTQTFALTRLLLAVLHGAVDGPRDLGEWRELWKAEELPVARIASYLARHRERFDLLHPTTPFMQVADLRTAKGEVSELSKLVADVPNGVPFFTTRLGGKLTLSLAEAARWVVHAQAFDASGIKSGAVGDPRVRNGKGYPIGVAWSGLLGGLLLEGRTLKETLLLNLVAADFPALTRDPARDRPVWEREPARVTEEVEGGRPPTGPVDLYTWQSRRIRLAVIGDRVTGVLIANGEKLTPQNTHPLEPHTAWRRSEAQEKKPGVTGIVYMPREHDPDRAMWRGLESLLPALSSRQKGSAVPRLSPGIMEWLGLLSEERAVPPGTPVRVRAVGMVYGSNSSVVDDVVHDTLALKALLAERGAESLARIAEVSVQAAEGAVRAVGGLAGDLAAAAGGDGSGPRSRTMEGVYALLDPRFRSWLLRLDPEVDPTDLQIAWHEEVSAVVRGVARELLRDIPPACWDGRVVRNNVLTAAHAEARFWKSLRAAVPFAFPDQADDDAVA